MATQKGVWNIQQVRDKQLQSLWDYSGAGELFAWGDNSGDRAGSLGQNNQTEYSSPVQIPGTTWAQVSARGDTTSVTATKTDGT